MERNVYFVSSLSPPIYLLLGFVIISGRSANFFHSIPMRIKTSLSVLHTSKPARRRKCQIKKGKREVSEKEKEIAEKPPFDLFF